MKPLHTRGLTMFTLSNYYTACIMKKFIAASNNSSCNTCNLYNDTIGGSSHQRLQRTDLLIQNA